jgi:hypothetical protein
VKPPLLYGPDGDSTLVAADDTEEKLRALVVICFGAIKGIARVPGQGTTFLEGDDLNRYRETVARKILDTVGVDMVEKSWGIRLSKEARQ